MASREKDDEKLQRLLFRFHTYRKTIDDNKVKNAFLLNSQPEQFAKKVKIWEQNSLRSAERIAPLLGIDPTDRAAVRQLHKRLKGGYNPTEARPRPRPSPIPENDFQAITPEIQGSVGAQIEAAEKPVISNNYRKVSKSPSGEADLEWARLGREASPRLRGRKRPTVKPVSPVKPDVDDVDPGFDGIVPEIGGAVGEQVNHPPEDIVSTSALDPTGTDASVSDKPTDSNLVNEGDTHAVPASAPSSTSLVTVGDPLLAALDRTNPPREESNALTVIQPEDQDGDDTMITTEIVPRRSHAELVEEARNYQTPYLAIDMGRIRQMLDAINAAFEGNLMELDGEERLAIDDGTKKKEEDNDEDMPNKFPNRVRVSYPPGPIETAIVPYNLENVVVPSSWKTYLDSERVLDNEEAMRLEAEVKAWVAEREQEHNDRMNETEEEEKFDREGLFQEEINRRRAVRSHDFRMATLSREHEINMDLFDMLRNPRAQRVLNDEEKRIRNELWKVFDKHTTVYTKPMQLAKRLHAQLDHEKIIVQSVESLEKTLKEAQAFLAAHPNPEDDADIEVQRKHYKELARTIPKTLKKEMARLDKIRSVARDLTSSIAAGNENLLNHERPVRDRDTSNRVPEAMRVRPDPHQRLASFIRDREKRFDRENELRDQLEGMIEAGILKDPKEGERLFKELNKLKQEIAEQEQIFPRLQKAVADIDETRRIHHNNAVDRVIQEFKAIQDKFIYQKFKAGEKYTVLSEEDLGKKQMMKLKVATGGDGDEPDKEEKGEKKGKKDKDKGKKNKKEGGPKEPWDKMAGRVWDGFMALNFELDQLQEMPKEKRDKEWLATFEKRLAQMKDIMAKHATVSWDRREIMRDLQMRHNVALRNFLARRPQGHRNITPHQQQYLKDTREAAQNVAEDVQLDKERNQVVYSDAVGKKKFTEIQQMFRQEIEEYIIQAKQDVSANGPIISIIMQKILDQFQNQIDASTAEELKGFQDDIAKEQQYQRQRVSQFAFHKSGRSMFHAAQQKELTDYIMDPLSFRDASKAERLTHSKLGLYAVQTRRLLSLVRNMLALRQTFMKPVYQFLNECDLVPGSKFDLAVTHLFPPSEVELKLRLLKLMPEDQRKDYINGPVIQGIKQFFPDFDVENVTETNYNDEVMKINKAVKDFVEPLISKAGVSLNEFQDGMTRITRLRSYIASQVNPQLPEDKQLPQDSSPYANGPTDTAVLDDDSGAHSQGGQMINASFNPSTQSQITRDKIDEAKRQNYRLLEEGYALDFMKETKDGTYIPMHVDSSRFYFSQKDFKALKQQFISFQPLIPKQVVKNPNTYINTTLAQYGEVLQIPQRKTTDFDHPALIQKEAIEIQTLVNAYNTYTSTTLPEYSQDDNQQQNPVPTAPSGGSTQAEDHLAPTAFNDYMQIDPTSSSENISDPMTSGTQALFGTAPNIFSHPGTHGGTSAQPLGGDDAYMYTKGDTSWTTNWG